MDGVALEIDGHPIDPATMRALHGDAVTLTLTTAHPLPSYGRIGHKTIAQGATNQVYGYGTSSMQREGNVKVSGTARDVQNVIGIVATSQGNTLEPGDSGGPMVDHGFIVAVTSGEISSGRIVYSPTRGS